MLDVNGNRSRNSAGSCRSRRREIFSHRSSFEWEEGLLDIKPRRDQSFSVLDDLQGHYPMRNQTNSMVTSGSRVNNQTQFDPLDYELKRSSMKKSNGGASIRSLIDEELSKNMNFRKQSPSVIAKLMGLDPLPAQNFCAIQNSSPSHFRGSSSEEFKDVYEVLESKKSPVRKRSPSKAGRRDDLNGIHGSREFSEKLGGYQSFEDPFLKLLHEPSSLFVRQSVESHQSAASQIVVLKSSSDLPKSDRKTRTRYEDEDLLTHCIKEHALSLSSKKRDPERRSTKREVNPTRIVVLKPSLDGAWDETVKSEYESSSRRESRRYCSGAMLSESRERKKLSGNSSRGIAREITENMIRNDGAANFSRSSRTSCQEKISGSYMRSIESSLSQEARKRLSERWKTANRSPEIGAPRRSSGATLAEILTSSGREFPAVENSDDLISREEILARWGSPLGITSCRSSIPRRRRRSSCPNFGSLKSLDESFSRRDSIPFIESSRDHRELKISLKKSAVVKEVPCLTENAAVDSGPLTREDLLEDPYATEEETLSDKREARGKDFTSSVEVAEHYSPVSVLDPPDERETSLNRFDRIKVDLQELLPESQHPKSMAEGAEAEEIRLTFEDEDNLEFCYLLDILIDSGLYKADRDTLLCTCFSLESPVDPQVFENLESIYMQLTWAGMNRKLMFDLVNSILAEISDTLVGKVNFLDGGKLLVEEVWESLLKKSTLHEACQSNLELDEMTWRGSGVDFHGLGGEIENMLNDDLLEELVIEVGSL